MSRLYAHAFLALVLFLCLVLPSLADAKPVVVMQNAAVAVANGTTFNVADATVAGVAVTGTFVGTITFEGSTDENTTWTAIPCTTLDTGVTSTTTTTTGQLTCNVSGLSGFRARVSAYTSGSITVKALPAYGVRNGFLTDEFGSLMVGLGTLLAGEAVPDDVLKVEERSYYTSITTAATTIVKSGPGWFMGCKILGGTPGNIKIWDNTAASGAVIGDTFTPVTGNELAEMKTSFSVGLTVVTSAATNLSCMVR